MADLGAEAERSSANNVGLLLANPLFLNLNDAERDEIEALEARNAVLESLGAARGCPPNASAGGENG